MTIPLLLAGILVTAFMMAVAKRVSAFIHAFQAQAFLLFLLTALAAVAERSPQLATVAALLFAIKVAGVPFFLRRIVRRISVDENAGLFLTPTPSLFVVLGLTYLSYLLGGRLLPASSAPGAEMLVVSLDLMLVGLFIMVCRMKALTQIIGLLVMENGLFLAASAISGGMPFFVEIAVFFDVFVCVIILGIFVYRINRLFTHIDVNRLDGLKG